MRLLNVRLDEEDAKVVRYLRAKGISISGVVRRAIRTEAGKSRATTALDTEKLLVEMTERYPTPAHRPRSRQLNSADRKQVQEAIRQKLRSRV